MITFRLKLAQLETSGSRLLNTIKGLFTITECQLSSNRTAAVRFEAQVCSVLNNDFIFEKNNTLLTFVPF